MSRPRRLPLEQLTPYLLDVPEHPAPLAWPAVFGNPNPVEMEIGFGKGLFLLNTAPARPEVNFVGVEIIRKYQLFAATRLAKRGLGNVRLALGDARVLLRDFVAEGTIQAVHVYFPDPWWKKRHEKRRLFTPEFAVQCERVLKVGGRLFIASDVEAYFKLMTQRLAEQTQLRTAPWPLAQGPTHDLDYLTNFERKFRLEGRPIYRTVYERSLPPS